MQPPPNSDRARPVAYWLVPSQIVIQAKKPASSAPAAAPARKPSAASCVCTVTAKPAMAATSIMPSRAEIDDAGFFR